MIALSLAAAFLLGLGSTLHCVVMCGGVAGALATGVATQGGATGARRVLLIAGFNLGRIGSYGVAGILAGTAGSFVLAAVGRPVAYTVLQLCAAATLTVVGLHLGGWFPWLVSLEAAGAGLWARLRPAGALFLPIDSLRKALIMGALWGWLPCGLVYSTLVWTSAHADPVFGAMAMTAFGLGTLPGMTAMGLAAHGLSAARNRVALRRAAALLIIAAGLVSAVIATGWLAPIGMPPHAH